MIFAYSVVEMEKSLFYNWYILIQFQKQRNLYFATHIFAQKSCHIFYNFKFVRDVLFSWNLISFLSKFLSLWGEGSHFFMGGGSFLVFISLQLMCLFCLKQQLFHNKELFIIFLHFKGKKSNGRNFVAGCANQ